MCSDHLLHSHESPNPTVWATSTLVALVAGGCPPVSVQSGAKRHVFPPRKSALIPKITVAPPSEFRVRVTSGAASVEVPLCAGGFEGAVHSLEGVQEKRLKGRAFDGIFR